MEYLASIYTLGIVAILMPRPRYFRVGGLRFLRIGQVQLSLCVCRR